MVVVGPDPTTGLLTGRFTVYYGVGDLSTGVGGGLSDIEGIVTVEDSIEILPVRHMHSHAHTHVQMHTHMHMHTPVQSCVVAADCGCTTSSLLIRDGSLAL